MPLDGMVRAAGDRRGAAVQAQARARRPEPALPHGRRDDQRRRVRDGLVRPAARGRPSTTSVAPAWGDVEPARARRARRVARCSSRTSARPRAPPIQQTNCHPFRHGNWLFVHNGVIAGLRGDAARPDARGRARAVLRHQGLDGLRGAVPPRADLRARATTRSRRSSSRSASSRPPRPSTAIENAVQASLGRDRRRAALGVPLLDRAQVAHAVRAPPTSPRCTPSTRTTPSCSVSATRTASSSPSRSPTSPARGSRSRSRPCMIVQPGARRAASVQGGALMDAPRSRLIEDYGLIGDLRVRGAGRPRRVGRLAVPAALRFGVVLRGAARGRAARALAARAGRRGARDARAATGPGRSCSRPSSRRPDGAVRVIDFMPRRG